jgi:hypothetical protein
VSTTPVAGQRRWTPPVRRYRDRDLGPALPALIGIVIVTAVAVPIILTLVSFMTSSGGGGGFGGSGSHDGPSLVKRDRMAKALQKIDEQLGPEGTVTVLRVSPERIDAVVREASGSQRSVQVHPDLSTSWFGAGRSGTDDGLSLERIDPAAPERIARRGARLVDARPGDLDYMALTSNPITGGGIWAAFFGAGRGPVTANLAGTEVSAPGQ